LRKPLFDFGHVQVFGDIKFIRTKGSGWFEEDPPFSHMRRMDAVRNSVALGHLLCLTSGPYLTDENGKPKWGFMAQCTCGRFSAKGTREESIRFMIEADRCSLPECALEKFRETNKRMSSY